MSAMRRHATNVTVRRTYMNCWGERSYCDVRSEEEEEEEDDEELKIVVVEEEEGVGVDVDVVEAKRDVDVADARRGVNLFTVLLFLFLPKGEYDFAVEPPESVCVFFLVCVCLCFT
jgi:hypothetical protein